MNELEKIKLSRLKQRLGEMSSEEALNIALSAEEYKKMCGAFDQATPMFAEQLRTFEEYAFLLEKEEQIAKTTGEQQ
ncbi:MAG: hypothetical protein ACRCTX_09835 [Afipia sp.]